MGRAFDRKWTDEQRDTVVRAHRIDGLSLAAAGRLVRDSAGKTMPRATVQNLVRQLGDSYMRRDAGAARDRLEQLQRQCAHETAVIVAESLKTGKQTAAQAKRLAELERMAAALQKQLAGFRAPVKSPVKPGPEKPAQNGHSEDPQLAEILAGA